MKKTVGKILLFLVCLALVVFLLLPFLQTPAPQTPVPSASAQATPQIFTSNPLTALVNRIARFFRASSKAAPSAKPQLTDQQVKEQFGTPQGEPAYADARAAQNYISTEQTPSAGSARRFSNAYFQDDEGEWVLIQQKAPELSAPGMHEINSRDNAYDTYVRQERAARFTPVARSTQPKEEVPDSKLARFFNPIKRFFGFGTPVKSVTSPDIWQNGSAARLASSQGMGQSRREGGSSFGNTGEIDVPMPSTSLPQGTAQAEQTSLLAYLDPDQALNEISDFLADSKYPSPKTSEERQQKEKYRSQRREEAKEYFISRTQERLNRLAAGQEPQDEMRNILTLGCTNKAPRSVKSDSCTMDESYPSASAQGLRATQEKNKAVFFQKTQKQLPPVSITPIIGKATEVPIDIDPEMDAEAYVKTMEIYEFMLQNGACKKGDCYWVANNDPNNTELADSVNATGAVFKGDPLGKYEQIQQDFTAYKMAQLPDATEEARQAIEKQAAQFTPPYILYTKENLQELQAENREALRQRNQKGGTALYALSAPIGKQLSEDLDSTIFFYGKDDSLINADTHPTFVERSAAMTNDLADQIQFYEQVVQEMKRNAAREVVESRTRSAAQAIEKQARQERRAFDKGNSLGRTERGR